MANDITALGKRFNLKPDSVYIETSDIVTDVMYDNKVLVSFTDQDGLWESCTRDQLAAKNRLVIIEKLKEYGAEVVGHVVSDDNHEHITAAIQKFLDEGVDMVLCTGGMSVDPDDRTPLAIKNTGAEIVTYGAPVLPGAMFLLSYYGEKKRPVIGLPGCVMYAKRTIFDLVLPRIVAGEILKKADIDTLGEGGLCLNCPVCTFPNCGFGK